MPKERIHKVLAELGVASRRAVEQMILDGRITVNGEVVSRLPCFVDLAVDEIHVDHQPIRKKAVPRIYLLLNKPKGVVCVRNDPRGRPCALDIVPSHGQRVYCVGGLDADATGLVLLTNDGELTRRLTHARYGLGLRYVAEFDGRLSPEHRLELQKGLRVLGQRMPPVEVKVLDESPSYSVVELGVPGGRAIDLRRILAEMGHKIRRLKRVAMGPLTDRGVKIGHFRPLAPREIQRLLQDGGQHGKSEIRRGNNKSEARNPKSETDGKRQERQIRNKR